MGRRFAIVEVGYLEIYKVVIVELWLKLNAEFFY